MVQSRSLLVTGGAGFIGSNFVRYWMNRYPKDIVVVLDALTYAGNKENLHDVLERENFRFVHGDICDQNLVEELIRSEKLDTIVHFAAESHVDRSISGPDIFVETNIVGTHTLLKAALKCWVQEEACVEGHRFHHVSTDEVYGSLGFEDAPFTETTPYAPNSPYSASKAASDHLVRAYNKTYGLQASTSHCSNNYGPNQADEKFIPTVIRSALEGQSIPIYGQGVNVRDWLHVDDHCAGIEVILNKGGIGQSYNIGGGQEWNNLYIAKLICELVDKVCDQPDFPNHQFPNCPAVQGGHCESLMQFVEDRPGHDLRYAIDSQKVEQLGYTPQVTDLEKGLLALISDRVGMTS